MWINKIGDGGLREMPELCSTVQTCVPRRRGTLNAFKDREVNTPLEMTLQNNIVSEIELARIGIVYTENIVRLVSW